MTKKIIGGLGGVVVAFAICVLLLWLERRKRKARNERPPQTCKLLRPPGYTLMQKLEDLNDRLDFPMIQLLGSGAACGVLLYMLFPGMLEVIRHPGVLPKLIANPGFPTLLCALLLTVGSGLLAAHGMLRLQKQFLEYRHYRLGLRGEQAVAESVNHRRVVAQGYVSFHDLDAERRGNIDHVTVGPGGIFVIETKTRTKRKATRDQLDHQLRFDGRCLRFPWGDDLKAVEQVQGNARWLRSLLGEFMAKDILIHPIIVVPGWWVEAEGNYEVKVMNAKYLVGFLESQPRRFTQAQLEPVVAYLDKHSRNVEF